jgi:uncharacterized damage-inducible protein DinB
MTIQELRKLFAYDAWATNRVFDALAQVPQSDLRRDLKGSHGGLFGTLTHLVAAEKIWLSRLAGKPENALMKEQEVPSLESLKKVWEDVASRMARLLTRLDDAALQNNLEYVTTEGKRFENSQQQILQHIVNHASYHRGQITTMMRQIGARPAGTDLIDFFRHTTPFRN